MYLLHGLYYQSLKTEILYSWLQILSPSWEFYCMLNPRKSQVTEAELLRFQKEMGGSPGHWLHHLLGGKGLWQCFLLIVQAKKKRPLSSQLHCFYWTLPGIQQGDGQCPERHEMLVSTKTVDYSQQQAFKSWVFSKTQLNIFLTLSNRQAGRFEGKVRSKGWL